MDAYLDGGKLENLVASDRPASTESGPETCDGAIDGGLRLSGENAVRAPGGEFSRFDPFTIALRVRIPEITERMVVMHRSRAWTDAGSQGWELLLEDGAPLLAHPLLARRCDLDSAWIPCRSASGSTS